MALSRALGAEYTRARDKKGPGNIKYEAGVDARAGSRRHRRDATDATPPSDRRSWRKKGKGTAAGKRVILALWSAGGTHSLPCYFKAGHPEIRSLRAAESPRKKWESG